MTERADPCAPRQLQAMVSLMAPDVLPAGVDPLSAQRSYAGLTNQQLGRFAEYHVRMALSRAGLDVYTPAIDDRGIDLIVRLGIAHYVEIQVKATRGLQYVFLRKQVFPIHPNRFLAYVYFVGDEAPTIYLIPSTAWRIPDDLFVSHDYEGKRSAPEYGLSLTPRKLLRLEPYRLEQVLPDLVATTESDPTMR
jgi:hypothetical protein